MMKGIFAFIIFFFVFQIHSFAEYDIGTNVDSRIKVLVYDPNSIYELNLKMGFQMFVEFSEDENMEIISLGDPYPWKVTPIDRRLFIKPIQPGAQTNLTVITNKRTYIFDIKSNTPTDADDFNVIHIVRFYYPHIPKDQTQYNIDEYLAKKTEGVNKKPDGLKQKNITTRTKDTTTAINLNYSFVGEKNNITTPIEIFDDRYDTFIKIPQSSEKKDIKIYSIEKNGNKKLVKQKYVGDFIVISGVHSKLRVTNGVFQNDIYNDLKVNKDI